MLEALCRAQTARFAVVGLAMTALHLAVFWIVLPWSVPEVANVFAFVTVTQVNFAVSYFWTWSARRPVGSETVGSVLHRALLFNGSAVLGFGVNAVVFSAVHRLAGLGPTQSAIVATVASAAASFLLSSRVVFVRGEAPAAAALPQTHPEKPPCSNPFRSPGQRSIGRRVNAPSTGPSPARP